jgi:FkbM family methyltransferase
VRPAVKRALRRAGWEVRRAPGWPKFLGHLSAATVLDVGAGHGTPELYVSFPDAHFVVIEPVSEYRPALEAALKGMPAELLPVAVGAEPAELELRVDPGQLGRSSFHGRTALTSRDVALQPRPVEVRTLDGLRAERSWQPPFFLKLDTEGHELDVIRGAASFLTETVAVLAEVSVARRFKDGYHFHELIGEMAGAGFLVANIIDVPSPQDGLVPWVNVLVEREL